jgi:deoxyribodipyrimidine photo-lyase
MTKTAIVLFRKDLRVRDNKTLQTAANRYDNVLPLYIFDPEKFDSTLFNINRMSNYRAKFLIDSLHDLKDSLQNYNSELIIRSGDTTEVLDTLVSKTDADSVLMQELPGVEEKKTEKDIMGSVNANINTFWTHTLYHPEDMVDYEEMSNTFTSWKNRTKDTAEIQEPVEPPNTIHTDMNVPVGDIDSFSVEQDEQPDISSIKFEGGEASGLERLNQYIWEEEHIDDYAQKRNDLMGENFSSKFSAWLSHGCLSPSYIWSQIQEYENKNSSSKSTYKLVFELMWRDFFQFQFMKYGSQFFESNGIKDSNWNWNKDENLFNAWKNGNTGIPFVDANMRELNETGYMSNRGRQNVASFLTDVLNVDWRMGAAYFESQLIDYDVCSNWGNWAYNAGVGNHGDDSRYFNVIKQGKRYDSNADYIKRWIPELKKLGSQAAHEPWELNSVQQDMFGFSLSEDYTNPIVDIQSKTYEQLVRD